LDKSAQESPLEKRAIQVAREIPVSKLERGLPNQALYKWLAQAVGPGVALKWEVNDCGEQTGDPQADRGRDFPLCVDAIANLSGGRIAIVTIAMGSFQKGIKGPSTLRSVSIGKDNRFDDIRKLSELPARVKAVH
jgi:hypothetical protein